MGGRGSSSASSRSYSSGDSASDKAFADAVKKYKDAYPSSKIAEKTAQRVLNDSGGKPLADLKIKAKAMVDRHKQNLKDVANFKQEVNRREKQIAKEEKLLKSYSKETRKVTSVRGGETTTNSKRYEVQAKKLAMLNQSLNNMYRETGAKERAIKNFKNEFKKEIDVRAKRALMAENYRKKKKK